MGWKAAFFLFSSSLLALPVQVSFSPEGRTKSITQVQARFSEPMVRAGVLSSTAEPFDIDCPWSGQARWNDSETWVLDFDKPMPSGIKCKFVTKEGTKSLRGNPLPTNKNFEFDTGPPSLVKTVPYSESEIEEDQIFFLFFDSDVDPKQVAKQAYFVIEGQKSPVGIDLVPEAVTKGIELYEDGQRIAIRARQNFPTGKSIELVLPKGFKSQSELESIEDQIFPFRIRPELNIQVSCERTRTVGKCLPILPITFYFSSPVKTETLSELTLVHSGSKWKPILNRPELKFQWSIQFEPIFPEKSELTVIGWEQIEDELGRNPKDPGKISIGPWPPLAKFASSFGVLEANASPAMPITIRGLGEKSNLLKFGLSGSVQGFHTLKSEEIRKWFQNLNQRSETNSIFAKSQEQLTSFPLPKSTSPLDTQVIGIPVEKPGFYVFEVSSQRLAETYLDQGKAYYSASSALVTNINLHFKYGATSSLVWATSLDKAKPLEGVSLEIFDCTGKSLGKSKTNEQGIGRFGPLSKNAPYCDGSTFGSGLMVFANLREDVSFTSSNWSDGIESWRYGLPTIPYRSAYEPLGLVLDRTLYRAGDSVHLKFYGRRFGEKGMGLIEPMALPASALLVHEGSDEKITIPLKWSKNGIATAIHKLGKKSRLGPYRIDVVYSSEAQYGDTIGRFRVDEFKLPALKGSISLLGQEAPLVSPDSFAFDFQLKYLSGGPASGEKIKVRARLIEARFEPPVEYEGFYFYPDKIQTGINSDSWNAENLSPTKDQWSSEISLDKDGFGSWKFPYSDRVSSPKTLEVEMDFKDPSGQTQTAYRKFRVLPAQIKIGLNSTSFSPSKEKVSLQVLVLDRNDKPFAKQKIEVLAYSRKYFSNRKRIAGGFYAYEHFQETKLIEVFCKGETTTGGILYCEGNLNQEGEILFEAKAKDFEGNLTNTSLSIYVSGDSDSWLASSDHHRMELVANKRRLNPGENLRIQWKAPFQEASLLVTVEREGILYSTYTSVNRKDPFVEIPILPEFAPNAFVSVLLVRGRVDSPKPTGIIDLAKPAFRVGLIPISVGTETFELKVKTKLEKRKYKVREKVIAEIQVLDSKGEIPKEETEGSFYVVDEALLNLSPNETWNLLDQMLALRPLLVDTSSSTTQVIGKRHFGLKARPQGGGGGFLMTREFFDPLVLAKQNLKFDKNGKATVEFVLNDSLTQFRLVAVVSSGSKLFGTGFSSIETEQDVQIFPSIPPVVRLGDEIEQDFVIRNRSANEKKIKAILCKEECFDPKTFSILSEETRKLSWKESIQGIPGTKHYRLKLIDLDNNEAILDEIKLSQITIDPYPMQNLQGGFQLLRKDEPLLIAPIEGQIELKIVKSLISSEEKAKIYLHTYPYNCLEQRLSIASGLRSSEKWNQIWEEIPRYLDGGGLLKFFPSSERGSEVLTSYALWLSHYSKLSIPKEQREALIQSLENFISGQITGESSRGDRDIRQTLAWEAISLFKPLDAIHAKPLIKNLDSKPNLAILPLANIISRAKPSDLRLKNQVLDVIKSRSLLVGKESVLQDPNPVWWLLSSRDSELARALLLQVEWFDDSKEASKLAFALLQRRYKGHWDTTIGNAMALLALQKYSDKYEKDKTTIGKVAVVLRGINRELEIGGNPITLPLNGSEDQIQFQYENNPKAWLDWNISSRYPSQNSTYNGYTIEKKWRIVEETSSKKPKLGDVIEVELTIKSSFERVWVVVEDGLPSGSQHMGFVPNEISNRIYPTFEEKSFSNYRAYFDFLPAGESKLTYRFRIGAKGLLQTGNTRVEAMYSPEIFGTRKGETWEVLE